MNPQVDLLLDDNHHKQLQINCLLNITQAINENVSSEGLFNMYKVFLIREMYVKTLAFFIRKNNSWETVVDYNISDFDALERIIDTFESYQHITRIRDEDPEELKIFNYIIPVRHKDQPISFALIGPMEFPDDEFNKIKFITTITNIIAVAIENKRLFNKQVDQEVYKKEIELASEVQKMFIPKHLPLKATHGLASIYKPHLNVGGDYFDYIELDSSRFAFCMADVSGKGVAAALLMANFQATLRNAIHQLTRLEDLVQYLNRNVVNITDSEKIITFFIGEYNTDTRQLTYINAGHIPPILINDGLITPLNKGCTLLGIFEDIPEIEVGELTIPNNSVLLVYTDGVTDIMDEQSNYFDENQLRKFLSEHYLYEPADIITRLEACMEKFKGERQYPDDVAILACKFY